MFALLDFRLNGKSQFAVLDHPILGKQSQKTENPLIFLKETFENPLLV